MKSESAFEKCFLNTYQMQVKQMNNTAVQNISSFI